MKSSSRRREDCQEARHGRLAHITHDLLFDGEHAMSSMWPLRKVEISPRRWLSVRVSIKPREFDGAAILAFEAAERGWGVVLSRKHPRDPQFPRSVVAEKSISPGRWEDIAALVDAGQKVTAICEEGLIYSSVEEYGRRRVDRKAFDLLDTFFSWGPSHTRDLVETIGCNPKKIVATGNPRFDLHRPELRGIFAEKVADIVRKHGRYILVTTKFSKYNGIFTDFEEKLSSAWRVGTVSSSEHETEMRDLREFHRTGFEAFAELTRELSRCQPDHTIIVRPHPSENHDRWKAITASLPNVKVVFEGNVIEWILGSVLTLHNNCTTGVEAYFLGKPTISYRPISDDRFNMYLPNALSCQTFELERTCELVSRALRGESIADRESTMARSDIARQFLANADGKLACERMMDALDAFDVPEKPLSTSAYWLDDLISAGRLNLIRLNGLLASGEKGARQRFQTQKFDGLYRSELRHLLHSVQQATGRFHGVKVAKLEENVLCLHK
jgi:surface carbohydrate biosynthesis protein